jgi:uncharacterized Zn finger protein
MSQGMAKISKVKFVYENTYAIKPNLRKQLIAMNSGSDLYKHFDSRLGFARINIAVKSCTCYKYFDKGDCKHLVVACMQNNIDLPGMVQLPK